MRLQYLYVLFMVILTFGAIVGIVYQIIRLLS